jgi:branched-subunit amino acid transport protein
MSYWAAILLSAIATFLTRSLPLTITPRGEASESVRRYLDRLPIAIIAALAGPGVALPNGTLTRGAEVAAALVAVAIAMSTRNFLWSVLAAVVVVAVLRAIGF